MLRHKERKITFLFGVLLLFKPIECLIFLSVFSRSGFLSLIKSSPFASNTLWNTSLLVKDSVKLPLRFLPVSGCWALKVTLSDEDRNISYYAVLDSGSPFLTAPSTTMDVTTETRYPSTEEQYGESTGEIEWRKAPYLTLLGNSIIVETDNVVVGIVTSQKVVEQSGGIFLGLLEVDDNRPSFLEQVGGGQYSSFTVSFAQNYLQLRPGSVIHKKDPDSFPLVDLKPFGPDLHHFAIECQELKLAWSNGETEIVSTAKLKRSVLVVLDTGLTGCIFSESLYRELTGDNPGKHRSTLLGTTVSLQTQGKRTIELANSKQYWTFSSFRLPWFLDENNHPHIIALGCTFWTNTKEMTIDTLSRRAKILLRE